MSISERTLKTLVARAGGRCSLCRELVVTVGTGCDDPSVFGAVAHVVAQSPGGPRAGQITGVDGYDNLILLCPKDHKRVDDQVEYFTVDRLRSIKEAHEAWVRTHDDGMGLRGCVPPLSGPVAAFTPLSDEGLIMAAAIFAFAVVLAALILHHAMTA